MIASWVGGEHGIQSHIQDIKTPHGKSSTKHDILQNHGPAKDVLLVQQRFRPLLGYACLILGKSKK